MTNLAPMSFVEGFLLGLTTVIFFGPVFFTIVNGTLQYGSKAGIIVTIGIVISDLVCVLLCSLATPFVSGDSAKFWLALVGGMVLFGMGIKYLIKPIKYSDKELNMDPKHYIQFFIKGFIVNFSSPFTFAYWLGAVAFSNSSYSSTIDVILFVTATLLGIFLIDILKVILAKYLKKLVQPKTLRIISIVCGIVLIGFAGRMGLYIYTIYSQG
jgi:threonine/homoserine/homoserine lactone efflux protein